MTGIAPAVLLGDDLMLQAARAEAERKEWTTLHELIALNTEIAHANLRQSMAAAGAKQSDLPAPLRIPRPDDETSGRIPRMTPLQMAETLRKGGVRGG